ncbi:MAG: class I SAM-dependent methyltransferase [Desulfobacterales bacterium]|nr:class I SAM-dependent methyltransferase [Desulfobacterales bacterium]
MMSSCYAPGRCGRRILAWLLAFHRTCRVPHGSPIETALDLVFASADGFIRPVQKRSEIERLLAWLVPRRPATVVEIGTASGGSLLLFARAAAEDALIVSIDLPGGQFGGGYRPWRIPLYKSFARKRQRLHLIRADSHRPATVARLKKILDGRPIDFLFIDGDHRYEGVKTDFALYRPLMAPGGAVAFHDIATTAPKSRCDVHRFWKEIRHEFGGTEFIEASDREPSILGIGLITLPAG